MGLQCSIINEWHSSGIPGLIMNWTEWFCSGLLSKESGKWENPKLYCYIILYFIKCRWFCTIGLPLATLKFHILQRFTTSSRPWTTFHQLARRQPNTDTYTDVVEIESLCIYYWSKVLILAKCSYSSGQTQLFLTGFGQCVIIDLARSFHVTVWFKSIQTPILLVKFTYCRY